MQLRNKPGLAVLASLVALAALAHAAAADELYSSMWDKGVVVVLYGSQYGTGWWVNEEYIVTAAHVVNYQSAGKCTVIHGDYESVAYVVYVDSLHDVAVLKVERKPSGEIYVWSLSARDPEKGQEIYVVGYPFELYKIIGDIGVMSSNPRVSQGIVNWVYPDKELFEFQASTDSGNSGGPIVDVSGNVVGLVSFALEGNVANMYYGTSVSAIKEALSRIGVKYRVGLSSALTSSGSSSVMQPAMIAAVAGGAAAIVTTSLMVPMLRGRKR
ncbi:MAG: hypothetical protein DRO36_06945 [Candidatus Hecatellales archaeon]|nr:MAG: hypothetical protein DRO36_06945 [Candidatus Hecatellales archaeon]